MGRLKTILLLLVLVLIFILSHRSWFGPGVITGGDWGYTQSATVKEWFSLPYLWRTSASFGSFNTSLYLYPWLLLMGVLSHIKVGYDLSFRFIFLWPIALLSGFSMYFLTWRFFNNRIVSFFSALFYALNLHVLIMDNGLLLGMMVYALFPLTFYFFHNAITSSSLKKSILSGLLLSVNFFFEPRFAALVCSLLILWTAVQWIYEREKIGNIKHAIVRVTIIFSIALGTLAFWLIPLFFANGLSATTQLLDTTPLGTRFNTLMSLFFSHPDWTGGIPSIGQTLPPKFYLFIFPFLAFFIFTRKKQKTFTLFLGILALIGIFFFNGGAAPFTNLYNFIFEHIPLFNVFRDSSKFYLVIGFAYAILIGLSLQSIYTQFIKSVLYKKITAYFLVFSVAALILFIAKPAFLAGVPHTDSFKYTYIALSQPEEFTKFNSYLLSQPGFFRTFSIPAIERFLVATNDKALVGAEQISTVMEPFNDSQHFFAESENVQYLNNPRGFKNFLDITGEKYVVTPFGLINETYPYADKAFYIQSLKKVQGLKPLTQFTDLQVFENKDAYPLFYTSNSYMYISKSSLGNWALNNLSPKQIMLFFDKNGWNSKNELQNNAQITKNPAAETVINGQLTSYRSNALQPDYSTSQKLSDLYFSFARWSPSSIMYPFIRWQEDITAKGIHQQDKLLAYELALSNKRLLEVDILLGQGDYARISTVYRDYFQEIQTIQNQVIAQNSTFPNELKSINQYFALHRQVIPVQISQIPDPQIQKESYAIQGKINDIFALFGLSNRPYIPNHEWSTFYFTTPLSGTYSLNMVLPPNIDEYAADFSTTTMQVDNQPIMQITSKQTANEINLSEIPLQKGNHIISLSLPVSRDMVVTRGTDSAQLGESFDFFGNDNQTPTVYDIETLPPGNKYIVSFDYRTLVDSKNCFYIAQDTDISGVYAHCDDTNHKHAVEDQLVPTPYWQHYSAQYTPRWDTKESKIGFDSNYPLSTDPVISIKNFAITRVWNPEVYLKLDKSVLSEPQLPPVFFVKDNPTRYTVTLQKSDKPFMLVFNQAFNSDWKLRDTNNKEMGNYNHYVVNSIFNGWYITPDMFEGQNTKTFIIDFSSQKFAYIGLGISVGIVLALIAYLIFGRDKKI